jgi:hypothetical protein
MIEVGKKYIFDYPNGFTTLPEYSKHRLQEVTVLGMVPESDKDSEVETMYYMQAVDGWKGEAFESELIAK